jgi:integrase/recombinase XerD
LNDYLDEARHAADTEGALFRPVSNNRTRELDKTITPDGVYKLMRRYALALKIGAHALRASAATNALDHDDIAKVQEWLRKANIATARIYDRRKMKPEDRAGPTL